MPLALIWRGVIAILLIAVLGVQGQAETLLAVPALSAHVIDQTGTLDASQRGAMEQRLAEIEQKEGSQLVVLMVPSTAPEDIAAFANRVGNAWKIGRHEVGDGVLIVVAKNDRKMRIEVAKALEGAIPDLAAARIIDQAMKPRFRSGDFAGGLNAAIDQLAARIAGEALPEPASTQKSQGATSDWMALAPFFLFGADREERRGADALPGRAARRLCLPAAEHRLPGRRDRVLRGQCRAQGDRQAPGRGLGGRRGRDACLGAHLQLVLGGAGRGLRAGICADSAR